MTEAGHTRLPRFEDSVGAHFLTMCMNRQMFIGGRHDSLDIVNHVYVQHEVRLSIQLDGISGAVGEQWRASEAPASRKPWDVELRTWQGRLVVPLASLDRHSQATTHLLDESGSLVPLFGDEQVDRLLGGVSSSMPTTSLTARCP